jgi:predicted nucleotidyltransferase component of viral defense system
MISRRQLRTIGGSTGLNLYQQEKDYILKLFLYNYFRRYGDAVFKGGTCIKYLFGTGRFSEDLDFNLLVRPRDFRLQVRRTLKELELVGLIAGFIKEESFADAYTSDVWFYGPLHDGTEQTRNRFRIDAGKRTGLRMAPVWRFIPSEYPETKKQFLVRTMDVEEILVEKLLTLLERRKGRDLYDTWFLIESGIRTNTAMFKEKAPVKLKWKNLISRDEYERDMRKLTTIIPPYEQLRRRVQAELEKLVD